MANILERQPQLDPALVVDRDGQQFILRAPAGQSISSLPRRFETLPEAVTASSQAALECNLGVHITRSAIIWGFRRHLDQLLEDGGLP